MSGFQAVSPRRIVMGVGMECAHNTLMQDVKSVGQLLSLQTWPSGLCLKVDTTDDYNLLCALGR